MCVCVRVCIFTPLYVCVCVDLYLCVEICVFAHVFMSFLLSNNSDGSRASRMPQSRAKHRI